MEPWHCLLLLSPSRAHSERRAALETAFSGMGDILKIARQGVTEVSRHQARTVAWVLVGAFLLLTLVALVSGVDAIGYVGIAALVGMAFVELVFDRCPHCGAYAGRQGGGGYCSRCGELLEEEP